MKKPALMILFLITTVFVFCEETLDQALENARKTIEQALPAGTQIVVLDFEDATGTQGAAFNTGMADYVTEKLELGFTGGGKLTVITRSRLQTVQKEREYQNMGYVSDEQAAELGKELGAQAVITGRLRKISTKYRLTITALNVETAQMVGGYETTIKSDSILKGLLGITALEEQQRALRAQEQAAARERRAQERQQKKQEQAAARELKEQRQHELAVTREQNAVKRDIKIILGARAALDVTLNKPSDDYFSGAVTEEKVPFMKTPVLSGFFGINSTSKAMGFRIEASYFHNNALNLQYNGNSREYSWNTFDVAALYNFGFAESMYLLSIFAGPYGSMPIGKMKNGGSQEIDKSVLGIMSSWGLLGGLKMGLKLGPGYAALDGRYFYDLNETKVNGEKFVRRSGILIGLGYEFWL
ncbi:MAG: CsgG/HfaB family protein [Treponema sp.]|jgi:TolB-like protein|nr:CsgG/HfaB family protein [Treponema sp.]